MDVRTAERLDVDDLTERRLDEGRPCGEQRPLTANDHDEVAQRGGQCAMSGRRAGDDGDRWHHAREVGHRAEVVRVRDVAIERFRRASTGPLEQQDQRDPFVARHACQALTLGRPCDADRAAERREVFGAERDRSAVDQAVTARETIGCDRALGLVAAGEHPELSE